MLYSKYYRVFAITVSFFSFFSPIRSFSQTASGETDAVFILRGNTKLETGKPAEGVEIEIKKNGTTVTKLVTGRNGKYSIKLEISVQNKNNEYLIYITHPGTIPKTLSINTYIAKEEYSNYTFPTYFFELPITLTQTNEKIIVLQRASGKIVWDYSQHAFAFDQTFAQTKEDDTAKLLAEKKQREEAEAAKKKAEEEARLKAEADAKALADQRSKEEAERTLQKSLAAVKAEMRRKRMQDSLDSLAIANKGNAVVQVKKFSKPVSPDDVDQNAFDGTGTYALNIAKRTLKAQKEKMNREKAANISAKYETNNTLTSLLNMVDEYEKNKKSKAKSQQL